MEHSDGRMDLIKSQRVIRFNISGLECFVSILLLFAQSKHCLLQEVNSCLVRPSSFYGLWLQCGTWLVFTTLVASCFCSPPPHLPPVRTRKRSAWPWWVLTIHPYNPAEEKGQRRPRGRALPLWTNAVWFSQQHPLQFFFCFFCMTATAVDFLLLFFALSVPLLRHFSGRKEKLFVAK